MRYGTAVNRLRTIAERCRRAAGLWEHHLWQTVHGYLDLLAAVR